MGRFAIRARLGTGGMGEVYLADDTKLKRAVALKRIAPRLQTDANYRRKLLKEAQSTSQLKMQHIAGIYDVLEENGETFLVMEYVEGQTLRKRLGQPLGVPEFLDIAVQCAAALRAAHGSEIVHCGIKPENIMVLPDGGVKILDFGVAKRLPRSDEMTTLESLGTTTEAFSGTPAYMAPEILLEKEPNARSDIYSLGVVFYEALAGKHPFLTVTLMGTCDRILHHIPPPISDANPQVPAELERIVTKMVAKDPAERYVTAGDLLADLRVLQRGVAQGVARPGPPPRRAKWPRPTTVAVLGVAILAAALVSIPGVRQQVKRRLGIDPSVSRKDMVVLPFRPLRADPQSTAFCDGLTETLTVKLTQLTTSQPIQVVPASEVRSKRIASAREARQEFGVSLAMEGTVDRLGGAVRVNYALVDTRTLRQVNAATITGEASDPFALQDHVAEGVLRMLDLELQPRERQALTARGTQVAGAYDFYLQGRGYLQNYDKAENIDNAITLFDRALALDARYALAHAGLGEAYWKKYESSREAPWIEKARGACERALELDAKLTAAHVLLGALQTGTGQYEKAVVEFQQALDTEPTNDEAYRGLALAYERLGKLVEAEKIYRRAIELRPHYWGGYDWLGGFFFRQARYANAAEMFTQVVALVPDSFRGYSSLGGIYILQGRYAEAIAMLERSVAIRPTYFAYSNLATAYFYLRQFDKAARTYQEAVTLNNRDYLVWGNLGEAYYWAPERRAEAPGAFRKAIALALEKLRINPREASLLGDVALYHAMLGERKAALEYLERCLRLAPDDPESLFKAARIHQLLGETQPALAWLEKALAAGVGADTVRNSPEFDPLRGAPRFPKLGDKK